MWSIEHNAWWGANSAGYRSNALGAGLYTKTEAEWIARNARSEPDREKALSVAAVMSSWADPGTLGGFLEGRIAELEAECVRYRELARVADAANGRATALVEIGHGEENTIRFVISAPGGFEAEKNLALQLGRSIQMVLSVGMAQEVEFEIADEQAIGPSREVSR